MNRQSLFNRLYFYYDRTIYENIHPEACVYSNITIDYGQSDLTPNIEITTDEFANQTLFVNRLQQSGTQSPVHREGGIDDLPSNDIILQTGLRHLGVLGFLAVRLNFLSALKQEIPLRHRQHRRRLAHQRHAIGAHQIGLGVHLDQRRRVVVHHIRLAD